jgi:hypothetical protein
MPITENRTWIKVALGFDVAIVLVMWLLLTQGSAGAGEWPFNWRVTIGAAMTLVAFVTFAGFYLASPADAPTRDPWMRNTIAASFVAFYLVLLTLLLVAPNFRIEVSSREQVPSRFAPGPVDEDESVGGGNAGQVASDDLSPFGEEIFNGFTTFLGVILAFYFAAQAAEKVTDTIQQEKTTRAAIASDPSIAAQVLNDQRGSSGGRRNTESGGSQPSAAT